MTIDMVKNARGFYEKQIENLKSNEKLKERITNLETSAKEAIQKATVTNAHFKESIKSVGIGASIFSAYVKIASSAGHMVAQAGAVATVGVASAYFGTAALTAKIMDKYFRKQVLNNTMDEASQRAYKMILLTIKGMVEEGKSEKEIIKELGSLNGAETQAYAETFCQAVKDAELDGAYLVKEA